MFLIQKFVEGDSSLSLVSSFVGIFNGYRAALSAAFGFCSFLRLLIMFAMSLSGLPLLDRAVCLLLQAPFSTTRGKQKILEYPVSGTIHSVHRTLMTSHFYFFPDSRSGI